MEDEKISYSYEDFHQSVTTFFDEKSKEYKPFSETLSIITSSTNATASLKRRVMSKKIDEEWIDVIEKALPDLDTCIRNPGKAIENIEEVLPVEVSRHISDKSIKHLSQHTNLILKIEGDEITPSKILNVYHDETWLTYENKFLNTLLYRLYGFLEVRYSKLRGSSATEQNALFSYENDFSQGSQKGKISFNIELTDTYDGETDENEIANKVYEKNIDRIAKIYNTILGYLSSEFARQLGKNFIRPPVIRTNAILKNKNMNECLKLWEYIEGYDAVGYSFSSENFVEVPYLEYLESLYNTFSLQYVEFKKNTIGKVIAQELEEKDIEPRVKIEDELNFDDDFTVFDSQYKKFIPISALIKSRKAMSEDEERIKQALATAIEIETEIEKERIAAEEKARQEEIERIRREEEEKRLAEEEERKRLEAEERERLLEEQREQERLQKEREEQERLIREEQERIAREEEEKRLAQEAERKRIELELERKRLEEMIEARRIAEELEEQIRAENEEEAKRKYKEKTERLREKFIAICGYTEEQYSNLPRKIKDKLMTKLRKENLEKEFRQVQLDLRNRHK